MERVLKYIFSAIVLLPRVIPAIKMNRLRVFASRTSSAHLAAHSIRSTANFAPFMPVARKVAVDINRVQTRQQIDALAEDLRIIQFKMNPFTNSMADPTVLGVEKHKRMMVTYLARQAHSLLTREQHLDRKLLGHIFHEMFSFGLGEEDFPLYENVWTGGGSAPGVRTTNNKLKDPPPTLDDKAASKNLYRNHFNHVMRVWNQNYDHQIPRAFEDRKKL